MVAVCDFENVFSTLSADVIFEVENELKFPSEAIEYLKRMIEYNVPGGKMNRGKSVFDSFKLLKPVYTPEEEFKANILGWCVEWLQAFFLVADDIMDNSKTRRGQPCWYLNKRVGNVAINDSFLLEAFIYRLLKKYFRTEKFYVDLLELFQEVTYQTELGQLMDLLTSPEGETDTSRFTIERYTLIVQYKTAYYSFYLPVALALLLAGKQDEKLFCSARDILIPMGTFFQVQDDYLDCFGDPETIGKVGTDIQDNKCSWLVVQAMKIANEDQLKFIKDNYGRNDTEKVESIKEMYRMLNIPAVYEKYEEESYQTILSLVSQVNEDEIPRGIFLDFAKKIYKRQK